MRVWNILDRTIFRSQRNLIQPEFADRELLVAERIQACEARRTPSTVRARIAHHVLLVAPVLDARERDCAFGGYGLLAGDAGRRQRLVLLGLVTRHRGHTTFLKMSFGF